MALASVLMVLMILFSLSLAFFATVRMTGREAIHSERAAKAYFMARSGIDYTPSATASATASATPVTIVGLKDHGVAFVDLASGLWKGHRKRGLPGVSQRELCSAFQLLGIMFNAGVPIVAALEAIARQNVDSGASQLFGLMAERVATKGVPLSSTMAELPEHIPFYCCLFVRVGEASGSLPGTLSACGSYMEREHRLAARIKQAMTGPLITLAVSVLVVMLCSLFVIPKFGEMYHGLHLKLPWITEVVFRGADLMFHPVVLGGLV